MTETGAVAALTRAHLAASTVLVYSPTVRAQAVVSWSPTGRARWGSTVVVEISEGPAPPTVPYLTSDTWDAAASELESMGLVPVEVLLTATRSPAGEVVSIDPPAGTTVSPASTVVVDVAAGSRLPGDGTGKGRAKDSQPGPGSAPPAPSGPS